MFFVRKNKIAKLSLSTFKIFILFFRASGENIFLSITTEFVMLSLNARARKFQNGIRIFRFKTLSDLSPLKTSHRYCKNLISFPIYDLTLPNFKVLTIEIGKLEMSHIYMLPERYILKIILFIISHNIKQ